MKQRTGYDHSEDIVTQFSSLITAMYSYLSLGAPLN